MGFGQGLSGLKGAAQKLDVIGNNIANAGTVGFKSATVSFADVYASSRVGLGTQVASVNQNFTTGVVANTGNQFDMAIDGGTGMFRVVDTNGNVLYTRNGEFSADKNGYIVNAQGYRLTGFEGDSTTPTPIRVPSGNIAPQATTLVQTMPNLNAGETAITPVAVPDPIDPSTYHNSLSMTVYDSQGGAHQLTQYFVKVNDDDNEWNVYYQMGNDAVMTTPHTLTFDGQGVLATGQTYPDFELIPEGATEALEVTINYAGATQYEGEFSYNFDQDGYYTGEYSSMSIGRNGEIMAAYTNGESQQVGFLVLANFNNLQGLQPVGGNAWRETSESGQPILGTPGTNGMALIKGQAVEESNVDMGTELVNMIITQRVYQANAQTITTQSEMMQTLINMR